MRYNVIVRAVVVLMPAVIVLPSTTTTVHAFAPHTPLYSPTTTTHSSSSSSSLNMVFDFFKQRSDEGMQQLKNLGDAAKVGRLGEGLQEVAAYTAETNAAFASGLSLSRARLLQDLELLLTGNSEDLLQELSNVLLQADLGTRTSDEIVEETKTLMERGLSRKDLMSILRGKLVEALKVEDHSRAITFASPESKLPTVLFIMGANGMGKTTTIGKLAHRLKTEGNQTVLVAACDTFRAGAVEQLQQWADRAGVECYGPSETKTSPAAVLYGALDQALADNVDTVLVDTSGRLSNNDALTQELAKMKRVIQKRLSVENDDDGKPILNTNVPHETLLVLDAAQGRMALDSAKVWNDEIGLTGLILTKLDGSARGGSVVAVSRELQLPVKLIGVGEGIDDLRDVRIQILLRLGLVSMHCAYGLLTVLFRCFLSFSRYSLNQRPLWMDCWVSARLVERQQQMKGHCWISDSRNYERIGINKPLRRVKRKLRQWRLPRHHPRLQPPVNLPFKKWILHNLHSHKVASIVHRKSQTGKRRERRRVGVRRRVLHAKPITDDSTQ